MRVNKGTNEGWGEERSKGSDGKTVLMNGFLKDKLIKRKIKRKLPSNFQRIK